MSKLLRFSMLLLAMALMVGFAGCPDPGEGGDGDGVNNIDYTNYTSNFSIRVKNDTNKKLVAFKGTPDSSTLIGGVPVGGGTHGLKKDPVLFATTSDFVLFLVTEEAYLANKNNLSVLRNTPFTRIYAYYNTNAENNIVYNISSFLGGNRRIILQNSTAYNVELRNNGTQGEIIGYTLAETYNTTFYVAAGDYMIFPVFRKYSTVLNEIVSGHPVYGPGELEGRARFIEFSLDNATQMFNINANDFTTGFKITAGAAFLKVVNNSGTGVGFWDGGVRQKTESGGQVINPNRELMFPVYMTRTGDNKFQEYADKAQFTIGSSAAPKTVSSHRYYEGKIYEIQVTGADANSLVFSAITEIGDWSF